MSHISNKYIMIKDKNNLKESAFEYIRYIDKHNYKNYDIDYLILLNKKFSYPMFLTSSNKEEVKFTYDFYYELDENRYFNVEEIDELLSEDYYYSYNDVKTIIELKIKGEKINFEFDEMIDMVIFDNKTILDIISDRLPLHLWGYKYFSENGKLYRENYL